MIARVAGKLAEIGRGSVVVMGGGVGYQLFISERSMRRLPKMGETVEYFTRQIVRENELSLYGFESAGERRLFDLLITVNGLGPKSALSILSTLDEDAIVGAILQKDWKALTRAAGVGAKLAEKVCLELVDKVREESLLGTIGKGRTAVSDDVVEALVSLGHKRSDAERAAISARESTDETDPSALIPIALQIASKK